MTAAASTGSMLLINESCIPAVAGHLALSLHHVVGLHSTCMCMRDGMAGTRMHGPACMPLVFCLQIHWDDAATVHDRC